MTPTPDYLVNKEISKIEIEYDRINFILKDGSSLIAYHGQDCCEDVHIEKITGDLLNIIKNTITSISNEAGFDTPKNVKIPEWPPESITWTSLKIRSEVGEVEFLWRGESNGYYSESVDFQIEDVK